MRLYRRRKDASQKLVIATFRALGCSVVEVENVKKGVPDLCCGYLGKDYLVEVKPDKARTSQRVKSDAQNEFAAQWRGGRIPIVRNVGDVQALVRLWRQTAEIQSEAALALVEKRRANGQPEPMLMAAVS